jgi:hypothetical protein
MPNSLPKKIILSLFICYCFNPVFSQIQNYYLNNKTPEYKQVIRFYDSISKKKPFFKLLTYGKTDVGLPLHLFVISKSKNFKPTEIHHQKKLVLMINNGIHPGEPDGIDACLNIVKAYADNPNLIPDSVVICIVPVLNIDGSLRRNSEMRMNQNGPEEFGFRGNYKNLDLNRDFIKCDAGNTTSFIKMFHDWQPELFIDTHVSNGADYPYTMTLIYPNSGKINSINRRVPLPDIITGNVSKLMDSIGDKICPYVDHVAATPDSGIYEFNQTPRYITGFTSLFNCISYVTESHMLKPYPQRVKSTINILKSFISCASKYRNDLIEWKRENEKEELRSKIQYYNWGINKEISSTFSFSGYEAVYVESKISGLPGLRYDRQKIWSREIPFYNSFTPGDTAVVPDYYVVPQCWTGVIELLQVNQIQLKKILNDTVINVEATYIQDFKTVSKPYEGHYLHYAIKTKSIPLQMKCYKGDYLISTKQKGRRYLSEALEAKSNDGFFAWNFFDAVLQQKEWFSDYAFEEVAEKILIEDPQLKSKLESEKLKNSELKNNHWQQLNYIFQNSKYKEKSHFQYPVYKIKSN